MGRYWLLAALTGVLAAGYWQRAALLTAAGERLAAAKELERAEVVIPLEGHAGRLKEAVELVRAGVAEKILVVGADIAYRDYYCVDVPRGRLVFGAEPAYRTADEARVARRAADEHGFRSALVVTSWYHLRRARRLFEKEFAGSGVRLGFRASGKDPFTAADWWKSYIGVKLVATEYIGLIWQGW